MTVPDPASNLECNLPIHAASARRGMGLTVEAVAKLAGIDPATIDVVERGAIAEVRHEDLVRLAQFLGLQLDGTPRPKPEGSGQAAGWAIERRHLKQDQVALSRPERPGPRVGDDGLASGGSTGTRHRGPE